MPSKFQNGPKPSSASRFMIKNYQNFQNVGIKNFVRPKQFRFKMSIFTEDKPRDSILLEPIRRPSRLRRPSKDDTFSDFQVDLALLETPDADFLGKDPFF